MRNVITYQAESQTDGSVKLSRCTKGTTEEYVAQDWLTAIDFLISPPAGSDLVFTVCFSLHDFTRALFGLLPE